MRENLASNPQTRVHVAMATDDNYAYHSAAVISSILKNISGERILCLHIIYDQLSEEVKQRIRSLAAIRFFELDFIHIDCRYYERFESTWSRHTSKLTYGRLNLGAMLPDIKKCLYLDCDVIVRTDISEIYDTDISGYFFGAVEEPEELRFFRNNDLGIPANHGYFNAGVILFNLDIMRENDFAGRTLTFLEKNNGKLFFGDQDALNALYYDEWLPLPLKYNAFTGVYLLGTATKYLSYSKKEIIDALKNPAIVHFTQKEKPDSFLCMHPFACEYWKYLQWTPWAYEIALKDRTGKNGLRKTLWILRYFLRRVPFFAELREVKRRATGYYSKQELKTGMINCNV